MAYGLKQSLLKELNLKSAKSEAEINENPFLLLGFGVNAYFDILSMLSTMFICITIFSIPIMWCYSRGDGFVDSPTFPISQFMLGNMGASSVICDHTNMFAG
jgi:hypothetical protein